jgi:hypothetical protein
MQKGVAHFLVHSYNKSVISKEVKHITFNDFVNHLCEREVGSLRMELLRAQFLELSQTQASVS